MKRINVNGVLLWEFERLSSHPEIRHFVTDRHSGGAGEPFTLSYSSHPDRAFVDENRRKLAVAMGITANRLFLPSQVHGTRIVCVTSETSKNDLMETDALISAEREVCIAVMSADCVPILLFDPLNRAVGAVHAGWRGTVSTILDKTIDAMKRQFNTDPRQLIAGIGPSICQDSYEVGEEVIVEVENTFGKSMELIRPTENGRGKLDLWKANMLQLLDAGVAEGNIEIGGLCTAQNTNSFFSARKGDKGRFAAGIMLS